jgi:hypothetical protein
LSTSYTARRESFEYVSYTLFAFVLLLLTRERPATERGAVCRLERKRAEGTKQTLALANLFCRAKRDDDKRKKTNKSNTGCEQKKSKKNTTKITARPPLPRGLQGRHTRRPL